MLFTESILEWFCGMQFIRQDRIRNSIHSIQLPVLRVSTLSNIDYLTAFREKDKRAGLVSINYAGAFKLRKKEGFFECGESKYCIFRSIWRFLFYILTLFAHKWRKSGKNTKPCPQKVFSCHP